MSNFIFTSYEQLREFTDNAASFWRDGKEIKPEQLDDSHPDKSQLELVDALEHVISTASVKLFQDNSNNPSGKQVEQIIRDGNFQSTFRNLTEQFKEEADKLYQDRNIETKAEVPFMQQFLED